MTQGALFSNPNVGVKFSHCERYRYELWRKWSEDSMVGFLMLNPSTADEYSNDPTITRCIRYAKSWGYGGVMICNLFAWRSTDRSVLKHLDDPVGVENDASIAKMFEMADKVIAAWGEDGRLGGRSDEIMDEYGDRLWALKVNQSGEPAHPLYLKQKLNPVLLTELRRRV